MTFPRYRRPPDVNLFRFPLPTPGRLALVNVDFPAGSSAEAFASGDLAALEVFAPESIALALPAALAYAEQRLAGAPLLLSLCYAIVVLSSLESPGEPMTDGHRDLLWRGFGLPVFEQLLGASSRVIARECEIHDGLHAERISVHPETGEVTIMGHATGRSAEIVAGPCDCGLETPRLRNLIRIRRQAAAA